MNKKSSSKSSLNSRKISDNSKADQQLKAVARSAMKAQQHSNTNKKLNKENQLEQQVDKAKRVSSNNANADGTNKKIKKKVITIFRSSLCL